jgi:hypothetical protein
MLKKGSDYLERRVYGVKKLMVLFAAGMVVCGFAPGALADTIETITFDEVTAWGVNDGLTPAEGETVIEETDPDHGGVYDAIGLNFEDVLVAPFPIDRDGEVYGPGEGFDFAGSSGNVLGFDSGSTGNLDGSEVMFVFDAPVISVSFDWDVIGPSGGVDMSFTAYNTEEADSRNPLFSEGPIPGQINLIELPENVNHYDYTIHPVTEGWQLNLDTDTGHFTFTDMSGMGITAFEMAIFEGAPQWAMDNLSWTTASDEPPEGYTGIQIIGTSSNIMTNVQMGDTVQLTVNYRFFTRAGYGEPDWGGYKWTIVQDYSPANTVEILFDTPGIYFLVGHIEYPDKTWAFGDPQSGIVVEVWPAQ